MTLLTLALGSLALAQGGHDPRTAPTRVEHALFEVADGAVQVLGDLDGDGLDELVVQDDQTLFVKRGGSGETVAVLVEVGLNPRAIWNRHAGPTWRVGPDLDGDGARDIALFAASGPGVALQIVSGRTGARLRTTPTLRGTPRALVWTSDVDGDGVPELAIADPSVPFVRVVSGATGERLWRTKVEFSSKGDRTRLQNVGDRDGDGAADLLLDGGPMDSGRSVWISGRDGAVLDDPLGAGGLYTALGDLDGDGLGDLAEGGLFGGTGGPQFTVHASTGEHPWTAGRFPDDFPDWPTLAPIGDVDGDGVIDVAVGDTNFHLRDAGESERVGGRAVDLTGLTLAEAVRITSNPISVAQESGCAWVLSGRTGDVLMGVYGEPGSHRGLGSRVATVGDQSGDGVPDLAVASGGALYVFATAAVTPRSSDPFEWMPGHWISETEEDGVVRVSEEVWLEPAAGRMLGVNRAYVRGAESGGSFEFLRIERDAEGLALFAQPGGRPPTRFAATEVGPQRVLFTNPDHDWPTRILYRRDETGLSAEVGTDEEPASLRLRWRLGGER